MNVNATCYSDPELKKFCDDMDNAGLEVEHYHGRNFWEGPAVRVDDLQTALSSTKVPCQWDNMGLGYIVYPKKSGLEIDMLEEERNHEAGRD